MIKSEANIDDGTRINYAQKQIVEFNEQEDHNSVGIYRPNVEVIPTTGGHDHGSSKVKLKNIVDFNWELKSYHGQLLTIHMSGKYLAYGIKAANGGGAVRVVNKEKEQRALIRGMRSGIQDLAFAHISTPILACVDSLGNLFVHSIESSLSELITKTLVQIEIDSKAQLDHRVIWCPYIPEEDQTDADEVSKLMVLTRGRNAELWSISKVAEKLGHIGPLQITDPLLQSCGGMIEICDHTTDIVEATFSPDGTALATASKDGYVKFFQVYMQGFGKIQQPRCLHQWKPHGDRPISSLFFLDNHKSCQTDAQFWRFAITGCDNNTELKIWSCEVWSCLQTINFAPTPNKGLPTLKAGLDLSAEYLFLSDIYNKVLYIFTITKDANEAIACVTTMSQFLLPSPILSFGIVDAGYKKIRNMIGDLEDLCPGDDENEDQLAIKMYLVQPKSLQECHIVFRPVQCGQNNSLLNILSRDGDKECLPELGATANHNGIDVKADDDDLVEIDSMAGNHNMNLNLMTPDAFSSPAKKDSDVLNDNIDGSPELMNVVPASPSLAQAVQALNVSEPPLVPREKIEEQAPISGGSSPSREVREILSLADPEEEETETDAKDNIEMANNETWPNVPMVLLKDVNVPIKEVEKFHNDDGMQHAKRDQVTNTSLTPSFAAQLAASHNIIAKLDSLYDTIQGQRQEINDLRIELSRLRQETPVSKHVDATLTRGFQQQSKALEQTLFGQLNKQREFLDKVDSTIKSKLETIVPKIIEQVVERLRHQVQINMQRADEVMKENLMRLINGPHIKESLALAASSAAKPALDMAFKEGFTNVLLPGMEKACQTMFRQVQESFAKGTREYLQNVDVALEKQCKKRNDQQSEALALMVREELQNELTRGLGAIQEGTIRTIRETVRENLSQQLNEMTAARSRATTPGMQMPAAAELQARVLSLVQRGQFNAAFQQALSASDLNLVVLVCEKTEPSLVFSCPAGTPGSGPRCILQQPVILSLVQQLSADLGHRTELKHRWLEEAILNLDPMDPVTHEHMGAVLLNLQNQLASFITANPNNRSTRRMKMLAMAARALLIQHP